MVPLIPPTVAAAGVKSVGSVTAALVGRYRPTGVPRAGSREDRSAAYQRLMDAAVHAHSNIYMFRHMQRAPSWRANRLLEGQVPQAWETHTELLCGLNGVRMRGTLSVIAAAENLVNTLADYDMNEKNDTASARQSAAAIAAQNAFLDACRTDLAYDTRWYQLNRRYAERKFLRSQTAAAIEA